MAFKDNKPRERNSRRGFGRDRDNPRSRPRNNGNRSFGGGNSFRDRKKIEKFDAVCTKCKSKCQVPFKPTGSKPVLCSKCFSAQGNKHPGYNGGNKRGSSGGISFSQFKELESKVDKILSLLEEKKDSDK
jgi:CxxC-x17-CxxC domain-containing protein